MSRTTEEIVEAVMDKLTLEVGGIPADQYREVLACMLSDVETRIEAAEND